MMYGRAISCLKFSKFEFSALERERVSFMRQRTVDVEKKIVVERRIKREIFISQLNEI